MVLSFAVVAQEDSDLYVQFMGIPVNGSKSEMISKIQRKGFSYNSKTDELKGRFNGRDAILKVVENNGVVYRVAVIDEYCSNEADIIIYFNHLLEQFENNNKYISYTDNERISTSDNIHYEMSVNNKRYSASFIQKYDMYNFEEFDTSWVYIDDESFLDDMHITVEKFVRENIGEELYKTNYLPEIQGKSKKEIFEYDKTMMKVTMAALQTAVEMKRSVWFLIVEDERQYRKYRIVLYYDNGFNEPNGEDL